MTETTKTSEAKLETEPCTRCGGSGHYSYCQTHGTKCFKCHGSGRSYTKRGLVAKNYLDSLRKVPVSTIVVGDLVYMEPGPLSAGGFARVTKVGPSTGAKFQSKETGEMVPCYEIETTRFSLNFCSTDSIVRKGFTAEEKAAQMQLALALQATLNKAGKPYKK